MRARYYNADRGRFLSEDPVWDENLFPYGNNNPATNIDPNGDVESDPWTFFGQLAGVNQSIKQGKPLEAGLYTLALYGSVARAALDIISLGEFGLARNGLKYTKSSLKLGQEMHKTYKTGLADKITKFKEFTGIKGIRPDFVDFETKTIYELKPFNQRGIQMGTKQLSKYKSIFEQRYGGIWRTILDHYYK